MVSVSMRDDDFPSLDLQKLKSVENLVNGYTNIRAVLKNTFNHHSHVILVDRLYLGGFWKSRVARIHVSSVTDHIETEKRLSDAASEALQQAGFEKKERSYYQPPTLIEIMPHIQTNHPAYYGHYTVHTASCQYGEGLAEKLHALLPALGGKKRKPQL